MCKSDILTQSCRSSRLLQGTVDRVIIFDWDDTICPSTFVAKVNVATSKDLPQHFQIIFDELCKCAEKLLTEASKHGEVVIITNAMEGWVEYSAERFVPKLLPVLKGIKIISARSRYEEFFPKKSLCWKAAAFAHEVNEIFNITEESSFSNNSTLITEVSSPNCSTSSTSSKRRRREIISFGDSMDERKAVKIAAYQLNASSKSIKFIQRPSLVQIIGQLSIVNSQLNFICSNEKNIDVKISEPLAYKTAEFILNKRSNRSANDDALKSTSRLILHPHFLRSII